MRDSSCATKSDPHITCWYIAAKCCQCPVGMILLMVLTPMIAMTQRIALPLMMDTSILVAERDITQANKFSVGNMLGTLLIIQVLLHALAVVLVCIF